MALEPSSDEVGSMMTEHTTSNETERMGAFQAAGKRIDQTAAVRAVEEALEQARLNLEKAWDRYQQVRASAQHYVEDVRHKNVGEIVDDTFGWVREKPGRGLLVSFGIGALLGWFFRR